MCVKFTTVSNKGRQFPGAVGNRKWLTNDRQAKRGEGGNLVVSQFEVCIKVRVTDRSKFMNPRDCQTRRYTRMVQHHRSEMPASGPTRDDDRPRDAVRAALRG